MQFHQHVDGKGTKPKRNWSHNTKRMYWGTPNKNGRSWWWMVGLQLCSTDWKGNSLTGHCTEQQLSTAASAWTGSSTWSKLPGLHWREVNISEVMGVQSFLAQKSIPHLQYQFRCEETWHKGLTLVTAKSHTSLLNFRAQQPIIRFW